MKGDKVTRAQVAKLHGKLKATPFQANRVLAVIGSMYAFAGRAGIVADGMNPCPPDRAVQGASPRAVPDRPGAGAARVGHPRCRNQGHPLGCGRGKTQGQTSAQGQELLHQDQSLRRGSNPAAAVHWLSAPRILHLKWEQVDLERSLLFLADSKTGRKRHSLA
jgi:hypothetical protein